MNDEVLETIEEGRLYLLQTRTAKRPAQAAVRFAHDAVAEGLLDREAALLTIDADGLDALMHPVFDPGFEYELLTRGIPASPRKCIGKKARLTPTKVSQKCSFPKNSEYMYPVILGNQ